MASSSSSSPSLMYLPKKEWSPRYDASFYSFAIEGKKLVKTGAELPSSTTTTNTTSSSPVGGKTNFPAYYYEIVVYREHTKKSVFRRYSNFQWVHQQLQKTGSTPPSLPSGTCPWSVQDDAFAQNRMKQMEQYLNDALCHPTFPNHPAVLAFLQLLQEPNQE